ncbi:uncharacterized protein LOC143374206 [Andrena cerasifolii]|uniref:uncharacterized protein LOC143374206 n=1 Tax=Andrena cerasifolii TaxID=2819439 RepID=UPI004037AC55
MHCCPSMPPPPCLPEGPPPEQPDDAFSKYYRQIGTTMIGNQLIIRMEREKGKSRKVREWDPPCDCDVVEIQRPTSKMGPRILKGADNNRILFRVQSRSHLATRDGSDDSPQAISYEVLEITISRGGRRTNDQCRTFTIHPVLNSPGRQEVHTDRVTEGDENVFMLKVKKKPESPDQPKRNIELELRTPRPPTPPPLQANPRVQLLTEKVPETKREVARKHKRRK